MTVEIPQDLQQFVDQVIDVGGYKSEAEVVGQALRLLQKRQRRTGQFVVQLGGDLHLRRRQCQPSGQSESIAAANLVPGSTHAARPTVGAGIHVVRQSACPVVKDKMIMHYLAMRVYPGRKDSLGVSLRAQGQDAMLNKLDAWQLRPIWPQAEDWVQK